MVKFSVKLLISFQSRAWENFVSGTVWKQLEPVQETKKSR